MSRCFNGLMTALLLFSVSPTARADRLNAVWIGPNGTGGEGNWNTPANWNLGVVPNNGADGNGDGVPDIFDVRLDSLPGAMSLVHTDIPPVEVAGLTIDQGDTLELLQPLGFVLHDPDGKIDVVNNGLMRIGGGNRAQPWLAFAANEIRLTGSGAVDIGVERGQRGIFGALLPGGRIINGPDHTLRTVGPLYGGRIQGYTPDVTTSKLALTNEGTILVDDRADLRIRLNEETHYNSGSIRATAGGFLGILSDRAGTFNNRSVMFSEDINSRIQVQDLNFVNESNGIVRAASRGQIRFLPRPTDVTIKNAGVIEAIDGGTLRIEVENILNEQQGVVRARNGGVILLANGTFQPDPSVQIIDAASELRLEYNLVFENENNVLSAGKGLLQVRGGFQPAIVRGGTVTSGEGRLEADGGAFESVRLEGTLTGTGMQVRGSTRFEPGFTIKPTGRFRLQGSPPGNGVSLDMDLNIGAYFSVEGDLNLAGNTNLILRGGQIDNNHWIAEYTGRRIGNFSSITRGYGIHYDDAKKQVYVFLEPIPEPATVILAFVAISGVLAIGARHRWRQNRGLTKRPRYGILMIT